MSSLIMLHYIALCLSRFEQEVNSHLSNAYGEDHVAGNCGWPIDLKESERSHQPIRDQGPGTELQGNGFCQQQE